MIRAPNSEDRFESLWPKGASEPTEPFVRFDPYVPKNTKMSAAITTAAHSTPMLMMTRPSRGASNSGRGRSGINILILPDLESRAIDDCLQHVLCQSIGKSFHVIAERLAIFLSNGGFKSVHHRPPKRALQSNQTLPICHFWVINNLESKL